MGNGLPAGKGARQARTEVLGAGETGLSGGTGRCPYGLAARMGGERQGGWQEVARGSDIVLTRTYTERGQLRPALGGGHSGACVKN